MWKREQGETVRPARRDLFWFGVRLSVGVGLLFLLFRSVDTSGLASLWSGRALLAASMAFLVLLLDQWVCAVRWGVLLERKDVTQRFLFRLYLISIFQDLHHLRIDLCIKRT